MADISTLMTTMANALGRPLESREFRRFLIALGESIVAINAELERHIARADDAERVHADLIEILGEHVEHIDDQNRQVLLRLKPTLVTQTSSNNEGAPR